MASRQEIMQQIQDLQTQRQKEINSHQTRRNNIVNYYSSPYGGGYIPDESKRQAAIDKRLAEEERSHNSTIGNIDTQIKNLELQLQNTPDEPSAGGGGSGGGNGGGGSSDGSFIIPTPPPGYGTGDLIRTPNGWAVSYDPNKGKPPPYQSNLPVGKIGSMVITRWKNTITGEIKTTSNAYPPPGEGWVKFSFQSPISSPTPKPPKEPLMPPPPPKEPTGEIPPNFPTKPKKPQISSM